ncbi:glycerate kinase family protein [Streptococcus cameli]
MKVVVAIDSFKGSASSCELNQAAKLGVLEAYPSAIVDCFAIADGGEGTLDALSQALDGEFVQVETVDLLDRPMEATYFLADQTAYIEVAQVLGIDRIEPSPDTVEKASSAGLAPVIQDALSRSCQTIVVTLGGTGTSDGGFGLLENLDTRAKQELEKVTLVGLTDVENPYAGPNGYAAIFGPQKGATSQQVSQMDQKALAFVKEIKCEKGINLQAISGTGAAGGLGGALVILGGQLKSGFSVIAQEIGLEKAIREADLVLTGEGRMDGQSLKGKVPIGVARLAKKYQIPVFAFCGSLDTMSEELANHFQALFSIQTGPASLKEAMETDRTLANLRFVVRQFVRSLIWRQ